MTEIERLELRIASIEQSNRFLNDQLRDQRLEGWEVDQYVKRIKGNEAKVMMLKDELQSLKRAEAAARGE